MTKKAICVVGNPNCGKTTLFNALTGAKQDVGNWPGVTVEKKTGSYAWRGEEVEITDLPGIYSITPSSAAGEDERVARDYILTGETECVVNIIDASNLERNLYLTAQLIEMRVPMLVVVNMLDVAKQHKIEIRLNELEKALGCPVVGIVASRSSGISELKDRISEFLAQPRRPADEDPLRRAHHHLHRQARGRAQGGRRRPSALVCPPGHGIRSRHRGKAPRRHVRARQVDHGARLRRLRRRP